MKRIWLAQSEMYLLSLSCVFLVTVLALGGASTVGAQENLIKLRVGLGDVSLNKVPFVAAYEAGIYKKNGLDVEQCEAIDGSRWSVKVQPIHALRYPSAPDSLSDLPQRHRINRVVNRIRPDNFFRLVQVLIRQLLYFSWRQVIDYGITLHSLGLDHTTRTQLRV